MKLKCKQFNSDLTISKIYEVDENNKINFLNNSYYIKNDQGKYGYYNSYLFIELTNELIATNRDIKLKELGI